ncbi:MAG: hypothetical protein K2P88_02410 [Chitinophagaceae bacterium]|jgi:ABC-type polysaccharide/polyol phosphate export permease|uniref:DUF6814 family protein n=1 Tax=unclassified Paraflavitalea TaxID=2798305 RepID=UPI003D32F937|nr:hypothetical protein [Chitinophagaceae bacterium]
MNLLKKYLGIVWMLLAPTIIAFLFLQANDKIAAATVANKTNTILQWSIILVIFIPITTGLFIFGKYAWNNEYEE